MAAGGEYIRVRGVVQGVGFRPTVARLARDRGLRGFVRNDADGVLIALAADPDTCQAFIDQLLSSLPPLAKVEGVERSALGDAQLAAVLGEPTQFRIEHSATGTGRTGVAADAAACEACSAEVKSAYERRFRYPFAACTHCGPRFSVTHGIPYDRANTTLSKFALCSDCRQEYENPDDRRYHAQAIACHRCGPKARLVRADGRAFDFSRYSLLDEVDAAASLLLKGEIVAIKGLGGYHLCCDATNDAAVRALRARKRRPHKALAMMARDLSVIAAYAELTADARELLKRPAAPIVLLPGRAAPELIADDTRATAATDPRHKPPVPPPALSPAVAPDQRLLGFMLPYTPLHHLVMARIGRPIVCTSGNYSDDPQCIDDQEAFTKLGAIADWFLLHDRGIAHRVDDSVVTFMDGLPRVLRRARGYAPDSLPMPSGLAAAPPILALGGDLKAAAALYQSGRVVLSPFVGDLQHAAAADAFDRSRELLAGLLRHQPCLIAVDQHPEYRSSQRGRAEAAAAQRPLYNVQHHHAHIAACMLENGRPSEASPVLGIALDGLGYGEAGALWGGEFLLANYQSYRRMGTFKPVALLGGDRAARQPWRNLYAHLRAEMGWAELHNSFGDVGLIQTLAEKPIDLLESMLQSGLNAPKASSAGRLFDAVAAALGIFPEEVSYEGQAAMALEAMVTPQALAAADEFYPFGIPLLAESKLPYLEPLGMWRALLGDLFAEVPAPIIAARFHRGLADGIVRMALRCIEQAANDRSVDTVALSGGVFQNHIFFQLVNSGLREAGLQVLSHRWLPPNDGCLAVGQAAVAAARYLEESSRAGEHRSAIGSAQDVDVPLGPGGSHASPHARPLQRQRSRQQDLQVQRASDGPAIGISTLGAGSETVTGNRVRATGCDDGEVR